MEVTSMRVCHRWTPCVDCKDECIHAGQKSADCPYYSCPREGEKNNDCDHCEMLEDFVDTLRQMDKSWGDEREVTE